MITVTKNFVCLVSVFALSLIIFTGETIGGLFLNEGEVVLLFMVIISPLVEEYARKISIKLTVGCQWTMIFWLYESCLGWFIFSEIMPFHEYGCMRALALAAHLTFLKAQRLKGYTPAVLMHAIYNFVCII